MADQIPISGLPAIVTPATTDIFPVVQAGTTYKESIAQLLNLVGTSLVAVYVDGNLGSDTTGSGSAINPYATVGKALSTITTASNTQRYSIMVSGITTESATVTLKPWVNIIGTGFVATRLLGVTTFTFGTNFNNTASANVVIKSLSTNGNWSLAPTGTGTNFVYFDDVLLGGSISYTGRTSVANSDNIIFANSTPGGAVTISDVNVTSFNSEYGGDITSTISGTHTITYLSQADSLNNINITTAGGVLNTFLAAADVILGTVTVTGTGAKFSYDPVSYPQTAISLITGGTAVTPNTIQNTPIGSVTPNTGVFTSSTYNGVITTVNRSNNSATANQTLTSATTNVPFLSGNMNEVVFNSVVVGSSVGTGFTTNSTLAVNSFFGNLAIQTLSTNGAYIDFVTPANLAVGVYMLEYAFIFGNVSPIFDLTFKANGAGSYSNLRTGNDAYTNQGDGLSIFYREFITITTAGNLANFRWTANGKNASSTGFFVRIGAPLRLTKLG